MRSLMEMVEISYDEENKQQVLKEIGKRIAEIRKKNNITAEKLADRCNVSYSCIYSTEKGKTNISITNLIMICLALGCNLDEIIPPELYDPDLKNTDNLK